MELHVPYSVCARRKVFYEGKRIEIKEIGQLCQWKGVEIIEGKVCPDHIHMLVSERLGIYGINERQKLSAYIRNSKM